MRFSFLYGVKAPAGMARMEFCSRRLGSRADRSQLATHPSTGGADGGGDGVVSHHMAQILGHRRPGKHRRAKDPCSGVRNTRSGV